ncbi:MAG: phospholipase D-like domain-containing protein [Candidatus Methylomirabilia bacterium]
MSGLRLVGDGRAAFAAMFEAIAGARTSIFLEMYFFAADDTGREYRDCLVAAAQRGVRVLVLVDAWGSWTTADSFWVPLRAAGAEVRLFHPIRRGLFPFRNHRKLLLVDDVIAWLGGMNIADEYRAGRRGEPPWRDFLLGIAGPEAARLHRPFLRMWARADRPLLIRALFRRRQSLEGEAPEGAVRFIASGPGETARLALQTHRQVIREAQRGVDLAMGYFFPPGRILRELRRAVGRGVRVRLLVTRRTDVPAMRWAARGLYGRLLRAGIEVYEYLPALLHAKLAVADDTLLVGSANLDLRSDRLNHELTAVVRDPALAVAARGEFEEDLALSERVELEDWRNRSVLDKLRELLSYWLIARADIFLSRIGLFRTRW